MLTYDTRIKLTNYAFKITDSKKTIGRVLYITPKIQRIKAKANLM